jgi:hypothetical protein
MGRLIHTRKETASIAINIEKLNGRVSFQQICFLPTTAIEISAGNEISIRTFNISSLPAYENNNAVAV